MSAQISVTVAGTERTVAEQTTSGELFDGDRSIVVARVNGELRDLYHVVGTATSSSRSPSTARTAWLS